MASRDVGRPTSGTPTMGIPMGGASAGGGIASDPAVASLLADLGARLRSPLEATDVKLRPVGGGKTAAYIPGDTLM
jgi:hypothetical protein